MPLTAALARCDRELAEIDAREDRDAAPAYLVAMGRFDWERERRLIEEEMGERNALARASALPEGRSVGTECTGRSLVRRPLPQFGEAVDGF